MMILLLTILVAIVVVRGEVGVEALIVFTS